MSNISAAEAEKNWLKIEELLAHQRKELIKTKKRLDELIEEVRKEKELKKKGEN